MPMHHRTVALLGALILSCGVLAGGCSDKPSCKLLYKRYKKCDKMPLTEANYLNYCKKAKQRIRIREEIKCSAQADCTKFKACLKQARKTARRARMKKRWDEAMERMKKGSYARAVLFCDIWKESLTDEMKNTCATLPAKATAALMKDIAAKRDKGQVGYKDVKCWDLKRYAKKVGAAKLAEANTLCKEVEIARDLKKVRAEVDKQLKRARPFLPYYCKLSRVEAVRKLGTPYAKKTNEEMVKLCYRKLGAWILEKRVPRQTVTCLAGDTFRAIRTYKLTGPTLDKLMQKAAEKCGSKAPPAMRPAAMAPAAMK